LEKGLPHLLLDVREPHQYLISALPHSMNVPLSGLKSKLPEIEVASQKAQIIVICRRGNDSQLAVELLRENGYLDSVDITGGLESWARDVDPEFPMY
jgi:adenylyltransferase/sulfurtransferase